MLPQTWLVPAPRGARRDDAGLASHIGGRPYVEGDMVWPECSECDRPMTFLGELALGEGEHLRMIAAELCAVFICGFCIRGRYMVWLHDRVDRQGHLLAPPHGEPYPVRPCRMRALPGRCLPLGDALGVLAPEAYDAMANADEDVVHATWHELVGSHFHGSVIGGYGLPWNEVDVPPDCPSCGNPQSFLASIVGADCEPFDGDTGAIGPFEAVCIYVCPSHPGAVRLTLESYE
ncbi:MAG: hypothetical protein ACYTGX_11985 [Planctomycetota bacterium]